MRARSATPERRRRIVLLAVALTVLAVFATACGSSNADDVADPFEPGTGNPADDEPAAVPPTSEPALPPADPTGAPQPTAPAAPGPTTPPQPTPAAPAPTTPPQPTPAAPGPTTPPLPTAQPTPRPVQVTPPAPTINVGCSISPLRPVGVGERLVFTATQSPASPALNFTFHHGDGTQDHRKQSTAQYNAPGTYEVRLNWSGGGRSGWITCGTVQVVAARPTATPVPALSVSCTISPQRQVIVGEVLTFRAVQNPADVAVSYAFDHGDGTIDRQAVSRAFYTAPGIYDVVLNWSGAGRTGAVYCGSVSVVRAQTPSPTVQVTCRRSPSGDVAVGRGVDLRAHQDPINTAVSFRFDLGDGTVAYGSTALARYDVAGSYGVVLHWSDGVRSGSVPCGTIRVIGASPEFPASVGCSINPTGRIRVGDIVTFTAHRPSTNVTINYAFDHGDGTIDRRAVSRATYAAPGSYTVTLHWDHAAGSGTTACGVVTVDPAT